MKLKNWIALISFAAIMFFFVSSFISVKSETKIISSETKIISESEFEEILGHNAAVRQFGDNSMLIETKKIKVNKYMKEETPSQAVDENGYVVEESSYAKGYHRALNTIEKRKQKCPY
jgi:hypothetical protein